MSCLYSIWDIVDDLIVSVNHPGKFESSIDAQFLIAPLSPSPRHEKSTRATLLNSLRSAAAARLKVCALHGALTVLMRFRAYVCLLGTCYSVGRHLVAHLHRFLWTRHHVSNSEPLSRYMKALPPLTRTSSFVPSVGILAFKDTVKEQQADDFLNTRSVRPFF